jgi:hypothetical protein
MFPTFATGSLQQILLAKDGNMWARNDRKFSLKMPDFHVAFRDLLN